MSLSNVQGKRLKRIDLAENIGLRASGITRIIPPMEKMGSVGKETNERDAMIRYEKLTDAGEQIFKDATFTAGYISRNLLDGLTADELNFRISIKNLGGDI